MTNSNKILLTTLLKLESSFHSYEKTISQFNLPFSLHFSFSDSYNLFQTLVSAFSISEKNQEDLLDLLEDFSENKISIHQFLKNFEKLI